MCPSVMKMVSGHQWVCRAKVIQIMETAAK